MGIDEKLWIANQETLEVVLYLTSAPPTTTFVSAQDGTKHPYNTRKGLLVEYDTRLENTLIAQGVEKKEAEETALLFASGAEDVTVILKGGGFYQYKKIGDHAHIGMDIQDSEERIHRRACVRTLTYQAVKKTDKKEKV